MLYQGVKVIGTYRLSKTIMMLLLKEILREALVPLNNIKTKDLLVDILLVQMAVVGTKTEPNRQGSLKIKDI